jgi:hypothetical protein
MNLLLALFLIIFEAVFEGLRTGGHLLASEIIEATYLIGISFMTFAFISFHKQLIWLESKWNVYLPSFLKIFIGYILLRFALFDVIWNISAEQNLFYYGTVKVYDRFMASLGSWGWMWKGISLIWGIAWLTKWGNK